MRNAQPCIIALIFFELWRIVQGKLEFDQRLAFPAKNREGLGVGFALCSDMKKDRIRVGWNKLLGKEFQIKMLAFTKIQHSFY